MDHDDTFPKIERSDDVELHKFDLGNNLSHLFESLDKSEGYDSEQSTYTFSDEAFLDGVWAPSEIAEYFTLTSSTIKAIDISYDNNDPCQRPRVAITIYFSNGERVTLSKDPVDNEQGGFTVDPSDPSLVLPPVDAEDVGHLVASVLFAKTDKPDTSMARLLPQPDKAESIDPTNRSLAPYIEQLLEIRADSWRRQQDLAFDIEDDATHVMMSKVTHSNGSVDQMMYYTLNGTTFDKDASFDLTAQRTMSFDLTTEITTLDYELIQRGEKDQGSADDRSHYYDLMNAAIAHSQKMLSPEPVKTVPLDSIE